MRGDMAAREQQMRYQTREGQEQLQREEEILCKQVPRPATPLLCDHTRTHIA